MKTIFRPLLVVPVLAAALIAGCSSGPEKPKSPYDVFLDYGCATDIEHDLFDPTLPGYWLVGTAARIQVSLAKETPMPETFAFMIRTRATASKDNPSRLSRVLFLTPRYRVITGFGAKGPNPVNIISYQEKKEGMEIVPVESDKEGRFVTFEQVGERVKITLTKRGLSLLGPDFTLTWAETEQDAKEADRAALKAAERARRLM